MGHEEFSRINREREKQDLALYANPNLAAGTVKLLIPKKHGGENWKSYLRTRGL